MYKRFLKQILPRRFLPVTMLLVQAGLLLYTLLSGSVLSQLTQAILGGAGIAMSFSIAAGNQKNAFKVGWILLILLLPVFGITVYLMFNHQRASKAFAKRVAQSCKETADAAQLPSVPEELPSAHSPQIRYLENCGFPVYGHTDSRFLPLGEDAYSSMLEAMEQAQKYIFLEFFIIEEGIMWNTILEVLKRKAAQGIEVRLIYDDLGCFFLLQADYPAQLRRYGIQCAPFNPFRPMLTAKQNNRDHRKILSVDGKIAFTGGINLADEYINAVNKFGHWKDTAIRLEGHGAWGLTCIFLQNWRLCANTEEDPAALYPWHTLPCPNPGSGLVQPYADSPTDREHVGESVYLRIIHAAKHYLYICTPYLILDENIANALILAAKSGVDVRIITPHHWDKRLVHVTTRSYYRQLIAGGVKIYEYTPGFIHSKTFVCDDTVATVGSINLDYRSLYLHFECGACLYDTESVLQIKADTERILANCQRITEKECRCNPLQRLVQDAMRLFAPLL